MSRLALLALFACGCYRSAPPPVAASQPAADAPSPAQALDRGVNYLVEHQSPDGRWRSDVYATFRDGTALTPLIVVALQDADAAPDARRNGADTLAAMVQPDGTIDEGEDGLPYPVYTAALSVIALSHPENSEFKPPRDAWLTYLLDRQLTEQNGWSPEDVHYGGWGYYPGLPKKPAPGQAVPAQHLLESNLSATAFALDALWAAEHTEAETFRRVGQFLDRMRNPDEGYHFVAGDPVRNKAGIDRGDPPAFHSYGSATADGLRSRHVCCQAADLGCLLCRPHWFDERFAADHHPGDYISAHESNRNAVYFYYCDSVARTLRLYGFKSSNGRTPIADLARAVAARQQADGSWKNPLTLVREDDPLLATAYAVRALGNCLKRGPAESPAPRSDRTTP